MAAASEEKHILITGASQGIGAEIARVFAAPKIHLYLLARRLSVLQEVARACKAKGAKVSVFACDLTQELQVQKVAQKLKKVPLDLVVNNAGHFFQNDVLNTSEQEFDDCLRSNLYSAFLVSKAFVPAMQERKHGKVFFMGSVASVQAYKNAGAYCVAKHGLLGLARALRQECKEHGVVVSAILPGATNSPSWDGSGIDPKRFMPANDIAQCIKNLFALSSHSVVEEIILRPIRGDI